MHFSDLADTSAAVAATRSRSRKTQLIADRLRACADDEVQLAARFLAGQTRQDRLDVGWATLAGTLPPPATTPMLTVHDVDAAFERLARAGGQGSREERRTTLEGLFARATSPEQDFLRGLVLGDLRQGALEGVVVQGVAAAAEVPTAAVQRALMLSGDLGVTARIAVTEGRSGLDALTLQVFRPLQPMLAATSATAGAAFGDLAGDAGVMAVDAKLDGARIQVHRRGGEVRVYTRNLREVHRPDVVEAVARLPLDDVVLDGEAVALDADGRPRPFQETMSSFGSMAETPTVLTPSFFDCLRLDGRDLLDEPLSVRHELLVATVPEEYRAPRRLVDSAAAAAAFFDQALADGHEGVVCKSLDAPYAAGRRGSAWRKVKPVHTLDLVVLAAEWGSGRRRGWLSSLHLGAQDPQNGGFVMLGKTFKGLTDAMLTWQTERLLALETGRRGHIVDVRPELVVEIAFDGVQASSRYPGGVTLRFARVKCYREDKSPSKADTIDTVRTFGDPGVGSARRGG